MDYKSVGKKYTLYTRCAGIFAIVLILCVPLVASEFSMQTGSLLVIIAGLVLTIYLINKWYLTTVEKLLHVDLDLASWKQYIEMNKEGKRAVLRSVSATSEVALAYMTGDFETAIRKAEEILNRDGLQPQFRNVLQSYRIRSVVLSQPELSREELDTMIDGLTITDPTMAEKTKKMSVALYDLSIAHESNDYFETLTNEYKYPQLEIIYYKALNAAIKGDTNRANELLSQLDGEDERLYVVRMGKKVIVSVCGKVFYEGRKSMTNEEYYQALEDYINELKQLREQAKTLGIMMVGENLTLDELFFISALNRRVRFIDGFIQLLKSRNLTCAGVLVRTQLDNLMRVYAAFIANDKGDFVNEYLAGTPIRNLVDDENKK